MNLILVNSLASCQILEAEDRRALHIRQTLSQSGKQTLYVGIANGPIAKAAYTILQRGSVELKIDWEHSQVPLVPLYPLQLVIGMSRPQICRRILRAAPALGVRRLVFFRGEKGESAYARSSLWTRDEWFRHLLEGAEQAFHTSIPDVVHSGSLEEAIALADPLRQHCCLALDPYESVAGLGESLTGGKAGVCMAIGSERGWSAREREALRQNGWRLVHMGERVFRTDEALTVACGVAAAFCGWWKQP